MTTLEKDVRLQLETIIKKLGDENLKLKGLNLQKALMRPLAKNTLDVWKSIHQ